MKREPKLPGLRRSPWQTRVLYGRIYTLGTRKLFVAVQGGDELGEKWLVLALEIDAAGTEHLDGMQKAEAMLEQHAHALLGERKTERAARNLAERYAEKWAVQQVALERCNCEQIQAVAS